MAGANADPVDLKFAHASQMILRRAGFLANRPDLRPGADPTKAVNADVPRETPLGGMDRE